MTFCQAFETYSLCPLGVTCPKTHDYENAQIELPFAFNLIMGYISQINSNLSKVVSEIDTIKQEVKALVVQTSENTIKSYVVDNIKNIQSKITNLEKSVRSKGIPLNSHLLEFTAISSSIPTSKNKSGKSLNTRAMEISESNEVGIVSFMKDSDTADQERSEQSNPSCSSSYKSTGSGSAVIDKKDKEKNVTAQTDQGTFLEQVSEESLLPQQSTTKLKFPKDLFKSKGSLSDSDVGNDQSSSMTWIRNLAGMTSKKDPKTSQAKSIGSDTDN